MFFGTGMDIVLDIDANFISVFVENSRTSAMGGGVQDPPLAAF